MRVVFIGSGTMREAFTNRILIVSMSRIFISTRRREIADIIMIFVTTPRNYKMSIARIDCRKIMKIIMHRIRRDFPIDVAAATRPLQNLIAIRRRL